MKIDKFIPKNKIELLEQLCREANNGDIKALALAYLIGELCPNDRSTKHVFRKRI